MKAPAGSGRPGSTGAAKRGTTRRWVGAWVCGLVVLSCAGAGRSSAQLDGSPRKLVVLLYGFFKSDNARKFAPERARQGTVDLQQAHDAIVARARSLDWSEPIRVLSWAESVALVDREYSEAELGLLEGRRSDALRVLDRAAQRRGARREKPAGLKAPFLPSREWRADDRVLAILGLETVRRPDPKAVTSLLGCFWFSGDGAYRDLLVSAYNPGRLGTAEFAAAVSDACFRLAGITRPGSQQMGPATTYRTQFAGPRAARAVDLSMRRARGWRRNAN